MKLTVQFDDNEHVYTLSLMKLLKILNVELSEEEIKGAVIREVNKT